MPLNSCRFSQSSPFWCFYLVIGGSQNYYGGKTIQKLQELIDRLQEKLKKAVKKYPAEGLLFSGGLDSGILAYFCPEINAITVTLKDWGEDLKYADSLAKFYKVKHYKRVISVEEAINAIP